MNAICHSALRLCRFVLCLSATFGILSSAQTAPSGSPGDVTGSSVTSVMVTPKGAPVLIGNSQQFTAAVSGTGALRRDVTWSLASLPGSLSPGTIRADGLYITPFPAPAAVTVTATSVQDPTKSGSVTVELRMPADAAGPALTVDADKLTHAINPYIYGMNEHLLDTSVAKAAGITIDRWGGDGTSLYNYTLDTTNDNDDGNFKNVFGRSGEKSSSDKAKGDFNIQVTRDASIGVKTMGSMPMIGWTAKDGVSCSFSVRKYGPQKVTDPKRPDCGHGILINGQHIVNDPTDTYVPIDAQFDSGWMSYLIGRFGTAANGGIAIYDLDNEPSDWDSTHIDAHPLPFTYDELINKSIAVAKAIKAADPTAEVSGPVIDEWMDYFYSMKDIAEGRKSGPCYCDNGNPIDRLAHGDIPFMDYYLRQFAAYQAANGVRLLDYVDIHAYFVADDLAFKPAGNTKVQQARLNSTRVLWDPTYTDPHYTDPNNRTKSATPYPPEVIPMMQRWVKNNYPGTKTAITEYNWGGLESINGAVAQADLLGIFGKFGLDLSTLWSPPDPKTQVPGLMAFEIYRNYDGAASEFGNMALDSTSSDQGSLAVYGALRTSDKTVTVVVINKSYANLTSTLSLPHLQASGAAKKFLYSNANLSEIVAQPDATLLAPAAGSTTGSISTVFPAQSITLFAIPVR